VEKYKRLLCCDQYTIFVLNTRQTNDHLYKRTKNRIPNYFLQVGPTLFTSLYEYSQAKYRHISVADTTTTNTTIVIREDNTTHQKTPMCLCMYVCIHIYIYRVSQEECARLREGVPYVKVYRYNPKHLCRKLNGYGDNGQRS